MKEYETTMPERFFSYHFDVQEEEPRGELLQGQMHIREKLSTGWDNKLKVLRLQPHHLNSCQVKPRGTGKQPSIRLSI